MMPDIDRQINALEMRLTHRPDAKAALAATLRCWLAYQTADVADPRSYLHKANHTALTYFRKNESDIRLLVISTFISIEMERFDTANELLDIAVGYRNFLKSNEPFYYATVYFLYAGLEIRQKRLRSAQKHMRVLQDFIKAAAPNPHYPLMLGILHMDLADYEAAYPLLTASYEAGCESVFLYHALYQFYINAPDTKVNRTLLPTLLWAAVHQADVESLISRYPNEVYAAITQRAASGEVIYGCVTHPIVLRALCAVHILAKDYGPKAYTFYRDAERRQLAMSGLYPFLVRAAYANHVERVNRYAMAQFLRNSGDMDTGLKIYVYHLLLTDPALSDLLPDRKNEILQFCTYCLEQDMTGRRVNSLYYYFWVQCNEMRVTGKNVDKAEAFLRADLTNFEVSAPEPVRFIYVTERAKKGMAIYELTPTADGPPEALVTAADDDFTCTCLSTGRRNIVDEPVTVRRRVTRAEPALYKHFFAKGDRSFELLAYLSRYYLSRMETAEENLPCPPSEVIPVLEAALAHKDMAKAYRMRLHAALGGLYYQAGQFDRALDYYGNADENFLDDAYIEQILHVFLQTREWARAAGLIMRKGRFISDKALFDALKRLSGPEHAAHHAKLADAAYRLLVNSWFDHDLLTLVLAHYNGGQAEWQSLSRALAAVNITEPKLDEIIIKNSMWMHQFDDDAEKTFLRMASVYPRFEHDLLKQFAEYCTYEMLINDIRPNYETLTLLEKAYLNDYVEDTLLAYALCHVYLRNGLTTFYSDRILSEALQKQEREGLLFPVFKEYRDKHPALAYLEKNQPFVYRSLPDKNVWLYYRFDEETAFRAQRMRYLRFGLYMTSLPLFYHEQVTYYFSEEMPTGSITTKVKTIDNEMIHLEEPSDDLFFIINNALIYEQMFKYDQVEKIITGLVKDVKMVRSELW